MSYEKFYSGGWQSGETGGTPITPEALNHIEQGIANAHTLAEKPASVRDLLDNSNFTNPVNQRGNTSQTGVSAAYFIDRWYINRASAIVSLSEDGIQIDNSASSAMSFLGQRLEAYTDGDYTAVARIGDDIIASHITISDGVVGAMILASTDECQLSCVISGEYLLFQIVALAGAVVHSVKWAALYRGTFTLEAIPDYCPKGYGPELAACQRYLQTIDHYAEFRCSKTYTGSITVTVPLATSMRAIPTIVDAAGLAVQTLDGTEQSDFTYSVIAVGASWVRIDMYKAAHGLSDAVLRANSAVLLSAEL